jgi:hypothetical protein
MARIRRVGVRVLRCSKMVVLDGWEADRILGHVVKFDLLNATFVHGKSTT